jgi:glycosyltransferase involved in cell wall biosynthesis
LKTSAPGKTAEYLALGRPILVHAPEDTFVSWYFKQQDCGIVIDQPDVAALAGKLRELFSHPEIGTRLSKRAREAFLADFQMATAKERFVQFLERAS